MPFSPAVERWRALVQKHSPERLKDDPRFQRIALATIAAESSGDPSRPGDYEGAHAHSIGLFQLHDRGMGSGLSAAQRSDPEVNAGRAVPALARAYLATGGDPARTYVQAINPGARMDGVQVKSVMAAYSQGGGPGGPSMPTTASTRTTSRVPAPKPTEQQQKALEQRRTDLTGAQGAVAEAQKRVDALSTPAEAESSPIPSEARAARAARQQQLTAATSALRQAQTQTNQAQADVRRLEASVARDQDASVTASTLTGGRYGGYQSTVTPGRADKQVGVFNPQTGQLDFQDNPNYVDPGQEPMTPYQSANVEVSRMHAAAALMQEQVAQGTLTFNTAKDFLDRVEKMPPITKVGDKWYYSGMEPGGFYAQLGKRYGYTPSVVEANVADVAAVVGHPEYNSALVSGPYKRALDEGGVATGKAAGQVAPAGQPEPPASAESSAAMAQTPAGGDSTPAGPSFGARAPGTEGGPSQAEVQSNEQPPRVLPPVPPTLPAPAPRPLPTGRPTQAQVQANEQPPRLPPAPPAAPSQAPGDQAGAPAAPTFGAAPPAIGPNQRVLPAAGDGYAVETTQPNLVTGTGHAGSPPPSQPPPMTLPPYAGGAPGSSVAVPQVGAGFRDRMIQHLVEQQGKTPDDAARIADAYLAQQGG